MIGTTNSDNEHLNGMKQLIDSLGPPWYANMRPYVKLIENKNKLNKCEIISDCGTLIRYFNNLLIINNKTYNNLLSLTDMIQDISNKTSKYVQYNRIVEDQIYFGQYVIGDEFIVKLKKFNENGIVEIIGSREDPKQVFEVMKEMVNSLKLP